MCPGEFDPLVLASPGDVSPSRARLGQPLSTRRRLGPHLPFPLAPAPVLGLGGGRRRGGRGPRRLCNGRPHHPAPTPAASSSAAAPPSTRRCRYGGAPRRRIGRPDTVCASPSASGRSRTPRPRRQSRRPVPTPRPVGPLYPPPPSPLRMDWCRCRGRAWNPSDGYYLCDRHFLGSYDFWCRRHGARWCQSVVSRIHTSGDAGCPAPHSPRPAPDRLGRASPGRSARVDWWYACPICGYGSRARPP